MRKRIAEWLPTIVLLAILAGIGALARRGDEMALAGYAVAAIVIIVVALLLYSFRILREYQRAVVFQLGRFWKVKGPGLVIIVPIVQQMVRVDLRTRVYDVPPQDVITKDNISVKVSAVLYFRVIDPQRAIIQVENFQEATNQLSQTTLRSVLGQHTLDELLAERDKLNANIQQIIDDSTDAYDTIDWLVKNTPESNGKVGIIGSSYLGFTTLMAMIHPHPALKAAVPQSPMVDGWMGDDWFHNGAFRVSSLDYAVGQATNKANGGGEFALEHAARLQNRRRLGQS